MKRILVVDDDLEQRDIYIQLFQENGYKVIPAYDGVDALKKIEHETPDLAFTGIIMPRINGFELIKRLRQNPLTIAIPVIIFSHLNRDDDREKASKISDTYFMAKGYDSPGAILAKVRELLGESQAQSPVLPISDEPRPPANIL